MTLSNVIVVSGGFDPIHIGHVRMIRAASAYAPAVVVLNSDDWLMRKKGYVFMPFEERKEIIESIIGVERVESVDDSDNSVCEALIRLKPAMFGNGGDRTPTNTPEQDICREFGIELVWNLGHGGKVQSSSELTQRNKK